LRRSPSPALEELRAAFCGTRRQRQEDLAIPVATGAGEIAEVDFGYQATTVSCCGDTIAARCQENAAPGGMMRVGIGR
jgi:hypothetical protein